jgi:NADH dehydrogenase/NADH:ubiquinone oxidoreductase subunit G
VFPGPNGFGAAALSQGATLTDLLTRLEAGSLQAAVVVESETSSWSPRARQALEQLPLLIVLDHLPGPLVERAKAFFPTTVTYESNGTYVNRAGRMQAFAAVRLPGRSAIEEIHDHQFRRTYQPLPTDGDAHNAWWVLEALREHASGRPARDLATLRQAIAEAMPAMKAVRTLAPGDPGEYVDFAAAPAAKGAAVTFAAEAGLRLFRIDRTLGSETLSKRSEPIRKTAGPPVALFSPADAAQLKLDGRASLEAEGARVELAARTHDSVPPGVVLVPRDVDWPIVPAQGAGVRAAALQTEEVSR